MTLVIQSSQNKFSPRGTWTLGLRALQDNLQGLETAKRQSATLVAFQSLYLFRSKAAEVCTSDDRQTRANVQTNEGSHEMLTNNSWILLDFDRKQLTNIFLYFGM